MLMAHAEVSVLPSLNPLQGNFTQNRETLPLAWKVTSFSFRYLKNVPVFAGQIMLKKKLENQGSNMFQLMPPAPLGSLFPHLAVQVLFQG